MKTKPTNETEKKPKQQNIEILGYSLECAGLNPETSCFIIISGNCFSPFYFLCFLEKCEKKKKKKLFLTQGFQDILVLS